MFELNDMLFKYKHPYLFFLHYFFWALAFFSLPDPIFIAVMIIFILGFFCYLYYFKNLKLRISKKVFLEYF